MRLLKKSFVVILSIVMLFSLIVPCFAENDEIYILKLNGESYDITNELNTTYIGSYYIPFAAVMRRLGYTVEYNEIFDYVTAKKDDSEFLIEKGEIYSVKGEEKTKVPYTDPWIRDGVTLINRDFFIEALHYYADVFNNYNDNVTTICFTDLTPYTEQMVNTTKSIIAKHNETGLDLHNLSLKITGNSQFSFNSELFGSSVTSDVKTNGSIKIKDNKLNYFSSINTEGLSNYIDVIVKLAQTGAWYYNDDDKKIEFSEEDFNKPITFEAYADNDVMLVKSDFYADSFMYGLSDEDREKLKGKWIEVPKEEYIDTFSSPPFDFDKVLNDPKTYEDILSSMLDSLGTNKTDEALKLILDTYDDILNNCLKIERVENKYVESFSIDKAKISEIVLKFASTIPLGNYMGVDVDEEYYNNQVESVNYLLGLAEINISSNASIEHGMITATDSNYEFTLKNIPNPYKIPIGEFKVSSNFNSVYDPLNDVTLQRPDFNNIITVPEIEDMRTK